MGLRRRVHLSASAGQSRPTVLLANRSVASFIAIAPTSPIVQMRIGQTSLIVFLAKVFGTAISFVATIIFARILGAEVYGVYAVIIALLAWLKMFGTFGIGTAIKKRISEGEQQNAYFTAGILWVFTLTVVISILLILAEPLVTAYVSGFEQETALSLVGFLILLLVVWLSFSYVAFTLQGQKLVHVAGLLEPVRLGLKSTFQVAFVVLGYGLTGMLFGYALGVAIAALIGLAFVSLRLRRPAQTHLRSLFEYAKYSWLGSLKTQAYQDIDILILGAMVQSSLVGIYAIAWSFTKVLRLFGQAISEAVFPEISRLSAQEGIDATSDYIEDAVAYSGLIVIPGFVGGTILAERLLALYGGEFLQGTEVLWLLLLGVVCFSYMRQFLTAMNALDRPDLAFRVNLIFVAINVVFNIVLIWWLGWVGAAIASFISTLSGMILAHILLRRIISISPPLGEVARQVVAAGFMGAIVLGLDILIRRTELIELNVVILFGLVAVGAAVYGLVLLAIAPKFRAIVRRNLPLALR